MLVIAIRRKEEFYAFNFAAFMENLQQEAGAIWHAHFIEYFFVLLEKLLRNARIWLLKTESRLFKILHRLRGIKEKNGNGYLPE